MTTMQVDDFKKGAKRILVMQFCSILVAVLRFYKTKRSTAGIQIFSGNFLCGLRFSYGILCGFAVFVPPRPLRPPHTT